MQFYEAVYPEDRSSSNPPLRSKSPLLSCTTCCYHSRKQHLWTQKTGASRDLFFPSPFPFLAKEGENWILSPSPPILVGPVVRIRLCLVVVVGFISQYFGQLNVKVTQIWGTHFCRGHIHSKRLGVYCAHTTKICVLFLPTQPLFQVCFFRIDMKVTLPPPLGG